MVTPIFKGLDKHVEYFASWKDILHVEPVSISIKSLTKSTVYFKKEHSQKQLSIIEIYSVVHETTTILHIRINDHWIKDTPHD